MSSRYLQWSKNAEFGSAVKLSTQEKKAVAGHMQAKVDAIAFGDTPLSSPLLT
jgi:hypothetical protein